MIDRGVHAGGIKSGKSAIKESISIYADIADVELKYAPAHASALSLFSYRRLADGPLRAVIAASKAFHIHLMSLSINGLNPQAPEGLRTIVVTWTAEIEFDCIFTSSDRMRPFKLYNCDQNFTQLFVT